jgi:basic membrane protein A
MCSPAGEESQSDAMKVIMVLDMAGLGDRGFNDAGWTGVLRAIDELGVSATYIQSSEQSDYVSNLTLAAQQADVVVAMGFLMVDAIGKVARLQPETKFVFVDGEVKGDNIASYDFKAQEGAFLAGILAAKTSKMGKVGCVMGMDIPPVRAYEVGFRAGIKSVNLRESMQVEYFAATVGSFNDPSRGKALALGLIGKGCDIVLQLAGNTGLGVIEAAKEVDGVYVIGADMDQDDLAPGKILTSILKRIDVAVFEAIQDVLQGTFEKGHHLVGIQEGATGLTDMRHNRGLVGGAALKDISAAQDWIRKGGAVPATVEALEAESVASYARSW